MGNHIAVLLAPALCLCVDSGLGGPCIEGRGAGLDLDHVATDIAGGRAAHPASPTTQSIATYCLIDTSNTGRVLPCAPVGLLEP